ncbi:MAG: hypothetical protein IT379_35450 [Deltaproteobacteria bacterium]|nr:hypothetical protein [Deltaproteobacteria bacterium]
MASENRLDPALLFAVSLCVLAFEVGQIRAFSYAMDPLLVYGAIAVAMLGLGMAGVLVSVFPSIAKGDATVRAALCTVLFGATALGSMVVFARVSTSFTTDTVADIAFRAVPILLVCATPYLFGGLATTLLLTRGAGRAHGLYVGNLLGSAIGCFVLYPFLRPVGLERLLIAAAAIAIASATLIAALAWSSRRTVAARNVATLGAGALALAVLAIVFAQETLPFEPDPRDLYAHAERDAKRRGLAPMPGARPGKIARRELAVWDPVARVEVFSFPGELGLVNRRAPVKVLLHDGGAGSLLFGLPGHPDVERGLIEGTTYASAYGLVPRPRRMLIIGLGGGPDVIAAHHYRAGHVTAIEVNGATLDATTRVFSRFLGRPLERPNVRALHLDGRSFVEGTDERFDLIQISGTDTYSAGGGGAFMFSESYLYTLEAIERYVGALTDDGVLAMIRFGPEALRLFVSELVVLRRLGFARPDRHLAVVAQGGCYSIMLSKRPISREQALRVIGMTLAARQLPPVVAPINTALGFGMADRPFALDAEYLPGVARNNDFTRVARASRRGAEIEAIASMDLDYTPVTDDRPFFFQFLGARHWRRILDAPAGDFFARGLLGHLQLLLGLAVVSAVAILGPLLLLRRRARADASRDGADASSGAGGATTAASMRGGTLWPLVYFAAIGLAFLFVELALMQRTALFLGHPTYSISVTLFAILASSALGSHVAGRLRMPAPRLVRIAVLLAVALLVAYGFVLQPIVQALLPLPLEARVVLLVLILAPLGLCMGVPFPTALRALSSRGDSLLAWVQAVNGFSSVLASLLAVPLAMFLGFRAVLLIAAALYLLAGTGSTFLTPRDPTPPG